ncbi:MAG: alpha-2-macroglobulin family protein, partial [Planctomycetota bacterium]
RGDLFKVHTSTDRPVYRPDQTVHFKCIVRGILDDGYKALERIPVKVEIRDPRGQKLLDRTLVTNRFGTLSGDLTLGEEPALGSYQIRTWIKGRQYYSHGWTGGVFRVEEYKKPEFEVRVEAGEDRVEPGSKVSGKISARYYFGAPVAGGEVRYQVFRSPYRHWMPTRREYAWYYEDIYPTPRPHWRQELVLEGAGLTDENGELAFEFDAKEYEDRLDSRFVINAHVVDKSRRQINGSAGLFATRQPFFVRAETRRSLAKPGDSVEVKVRAEDANRRPVESEGKLVMAKRVDREEEKDGKRVTVTEWREIGSVPAATRDDGEGVASMVVDEEGQFRLSYVTSGEDGAEIRGDAHVWVVSRDFRGSQYRFSGVEVLTDKDTYALGEDVQVLVNSHVKDAWILLSVEAGNRILHHKIVRAAGRSHLETLEVTEGWTPNVWLKALTIRDEAVFMSRRQVVVPPVRKFLDVAIVPAKEGTYLPGEEAAFTVTAKDATGEPVEAELSVGFFDKSVLYIQPDTTPDLRKFFYGQKRGDSVLIGSSFDFRHAGRDRLRPGERWLKLRTQGLPKYMNPWFYNYAGMSREMRGLLGDGRRSGREGYGDWGDSPPGLRSPSDPGAPSGPAELKRRSKGADDAAPAAEAEPEATLEEAQAGRPGAAEPEVRKFFPDTAFWDAHVVTGADGKAEIRFAFPDSLTTWRATARGATMKTEVGTATRDLVTAKNVIMRLQAPRFFRERDEVVVSGIVHNYFDEPLAVRILVETEGGCVKLLDRGELSRPDQTITIPPKKEQRVDWWYRVTRPGTVRFRADARSDRESDAVSMSFPVHEHGVEKLMALSGSFVGPGGSPAGDERAEMRFTVPEDRHEDASELTVTVSPSLATVILETLPYLADYPYGCVEQTMSRFLPSVVVKKTLTDLGFSLADLGVAPEREVPKSYWGRKEVQKLKVLRDEDLAKAVTAGLKRLADFQRGDGSWGWWKQGPADLWMTSYVVRGLSLAKKAGVAVDDQMIARGVAHLISRLSRIDPKEHEEKGMDVRADIFTAACAAILEAAPENAKARELVGRIATWLFTRRETLGSASRALLATTLSRLGRDEQAGIVCENLTDQAVIDRENGTCRFGRTSGYNSWHEDAVESTAASLSAYLAVKPESELIPMMVKWLVANRRGAHWKSTRDTALATLALCDYLKASEELAPDMTVKVTVGGRTSKTMRITKGNLFTFDNRL